MRRISCLFLRVLQLEYLFLFLDFRLQFILRRDEGEVFGGKEVITLMKDGITGDVLASVGT